MDYQQLLDIELMNSIESDDFDRFEHLLKDDADPNSLHLQTGYGYMTPLMEASHSNDVEYIVKLLEYGANPNIVTDSTALHYAIMNTDSNIILELLLTNPANPSNPANPFLKDNNGDTAYDEAVNNNLINNNAFTGDIEILKRYMEYYAANKIQNRSRRYLTRKRVKRNKRLAVGKSTLDYNNPMSYMDHDTMLELSEYMK